MKDLNDLKDINDLTEDEQIKLVSSNFGWDIKYIKTPSEKVQLAAVIENINVIRYIDNPSEKAQLVLAKCFPEHIDLIKDPFESVQLEAAKNLSNYNIDNYVEQYITAPKAKELYYKLRKVNKVIK
jgi:hypothetical protein